MLLFFFYFCFHYCNTWFEPCVKLQRRHRRALTAAVFHSASVRENPNTCLGCVYVRVLFFYFLLFFFLLFPCVCVFRRCVFVHSGPHYCPALSILSCGTTIKGLLAQKLWWIIQGSYYLLRLAETRRAANGHKWISSTRSHWECGGGEVLAVAVWSEWWWGEVGRGRWRERDALCLTQ